MVAAHKLIHCMVDYSISLVCYAIYILSIIIRIIISYCDLSSRSLLYFDDLPLLKFLIVVTAAFCIEPS